MPTLFLLFNHSLSDRQTEDAHHSIGVTEVIAPPPHISRLWAEIPPEADSIKEYLLPVKAWLAQTARPGDYVLVQGEFGATWLMVNESLEMGLVPIYATTRRIAADKILPGGRVETHHVFQHVRYRRYGL
jgi:hypothetical protein